jgi:hypothetical protein
MLNKMSRARGILTPAGLVVYATNCPPAVLDIKFPAEFTDEDFDELRKAIVAAYGRITDRHDRARRLSTVDSRG